MANKQISSFIVPLTALPASGGSRKISITGEKGASFFLQVVSSAGTFYNFNQSAFTSAFNSRNNKAVIMTGSRYSTNIFFPAASGVTYSVLLMANPDSDTDIVIGNSIPRKVLNRQINAVANAQITFALTTANADTYQTFPSNITSTGSSAVSGATTVDIGTWLVENTEDDTDGFGLILDRQPSPAAWYFQATETVDGTTSSSTSVVVDDVTDLAVGMVMTYKTGTTAAAAGTTITAIDAATKTLTLSVANSLGDGNIMTFRAYGLTNINTALDLSLTHVKLVATPTQFTQSVRASVSASTTVTLVDTYGIAGGNTVTYTGTSVNNSAANAVTTVAEDTGAAGDGSMVVQLAQTFKGGEVLTFDGSYQKIQLKGSIQIDQYPSSNRTINFDLDKFITPGTDGS